MTDDTKALVARLRNSHGQIVHAFSSKDGKLYCDCAICDAADLIERQGMALRAVAELCEKPDHYGEGIAYGHVFVDACKIMAANPKSPASLADDLDEFALDMERTILDHRLRFADYIEGDRSVAIVEYQLNKRNLGEESRLLRAAAAALRAPTIAHFEFTDAYALTLFPSSKPGYETLSIYEGETALKIRLTPEAKDALAATIAPVFECICATCEDQRNEVDRFKREASGNG
jgi:hypothetical protein